MIAGWNGAAGKSDAILADRSAAEAVYKGLVTTRSGPLLYVAEFGNGKIDASDGQMNPVSLPKSFTDSIVPMLRAVQYHSSVDRSM